MLFKRVHCTLRWFSFALYIHFPGMFSCHGKVIILFYCFNVSVRFIAFFCPHDNTRPSHCNLRRDKSPVRISSASVIVSNTTLYILHCICEPCDYFNAFLFSNIILCALISLNFHRFLVVY